MNNMELRCRHISANCNPLTNSLTFLQHGCLAFAFSDQIAIYDLNSNQITCTLHDSSTSHGRANCLTTVRLFQEELILCGYNSGSLLAYALSEGHWKIRFSIKDEAGIQSLSAIQHKDTWHVVSNNNNAALKLYRLTQTGFTLQEVIAFPLNKILESVCLFIVEERLMMFVGGVDQKIHYYQKCLIGSDELEYKFSLSGHQNAITKLTLTRQEGTSDLLLASSSKDGYIRLWRITSDAESIKFHKDVYSLLSKSKIHLEAVLISHECSVTSLSWVRFGGKLQLASSSLDCTVCLWGKGEQDAWVVDSRMGQFIGNKNAYFDVLGDPHNTCLVAINYTGALLFWAWKEGKLVLRQCFNGHSNKVSDIEWNCGGQYLVSVSKDQTTRVIAKNRTGHYHQISRAQIHGYDINAVTVLRVKEGVLDVIACGADEKVVRILQPPACFANYLNSFTHANLHLYFHSQEEERKYLASKPGDPVLLYETYSEGGTQVLGLMTKTQRVQREKITNYYQEQGQEMEEEQVVDVKNVQLDYNIPPHQDYLVKHTLWPEMNKLYGHGHEIAVLCRSPVSDRMASCCEALNAQAASVIVWNTVDWKIAKILPFHAYTVYAMEFSFNDRYFATAGKDRKLAIYGGDLNLVYSCEPHLRAITCLSFHRSEEYLLTGSRDKTVKLHQLQSRTVVAELNCQYPVSAVAFCLQTGLQNYFAVGCANGKIFIGLLQGGGLKIVGQIQAGFAHSQCINSLKWNGNLLGSCGDDFSVRIFELCFK